MRIGAEELYDRLSGVIYELAINKVGNVGEATDKLLAILSHPSRRQDVLEAMGLEVRIVDEGLGGNDDVLIVRPRGDAS